MAARVVCISHATGAEGPRVGHAVSELLGCRYVDEEIVARAAEREGLAPEEIADVERRKPLLQRFLEQLGETAGAEAYAYVGFVPSAAEQVGTLRSSEGYRELIKEVIRETADQGDVVIVSHAASLALGPREGVLRVLVTASPATRARRYAEARGVGEKESEKAIKQSDAARADYLRRFYGVEHELPTHYDLVVSTDVLTPEQAASLVAHAAVA
jgi:hypothetical protein